MKRNIEEDNSPTFKKRRRIVLLSDSENSEGKFNLNHSWIIWLKICFIDENHEPIVSKKQEKVKKDVIKTDHSKKDDSLNVSKKTSQTAVMIKRKHFFKTYN